MAREKPELTWPEWKAVKIAVQYAIRMGLSTERDGNKFTNKTLLRAGKKLGCEISEQENGYGPSK